MGQENQPQETRGRSAPGRSAPGQRSQDCRILVILGSTAVGKTDVAIETALRLDGEIISADSAAVYRGMDVSAVKPSQEERKGVPFHLIDVADPQEAFTAGRFAELARAAIQEIRQRGRLPIVCGGTGLYIRTLLAQFRPPPPVSPQTRWELQSKGPAAIRAELERIDPDAAVKIHPNDPVRNLRALEVYTVTGLLWSDWQKREDNELPSLKIGLTMDRKALYERIDRRSSHLFDAGLVEETRALLDAGVPEDAPALRMLGVKQAVRMLKGELTRAQAVEDFQLRTRRYAKRQMTWFRREPSVIWMETSGEARAISARIAELWYLAPMEGGRLNG